MGGVGPGRGAVRGTGTLSTVEIACERVTPETVCVEASRSLVEPLSPGGAMPTLHGFCSLHRVAYRRDLDPTCPQCTLANVSAEQFDYEPVPVVPVVTPGRIIDSSGAVLNAITLAPEA